MLHCFNAYVRWKCLKQQTDTTHDPALREMRKARPQPNPWWTAERQFGAERTGRF